MDHIFGDSVLRLGVVDSTNDRLKALAREGAPEGTVVTAEGQTAGRGTGDRQFWSPAGEGLYLSVLLRPAASVEELLTLTGRAAVAVRDGIEAACGAPAGIKWLNDIWLNGRKVCGILTELSPEGDWVVLGVGINVAQSRESFARAGLDGIATSLAAEGYPVSLHRLEQSVLAALEEMYRRFPDEKESVLSQYCAHCIVPGRRVRFSADGCVREGTAVEINEDFSLTVESGGRRNTLFWGAVELL